MNPRIVPVLAVLAALPSLMAAPAPAAVPVRKPAPPHVGLAGTKPAPRAAKPSTPKAATEETEAMQSVERAAGHKVVVGRRVELETTKGKIVVGLFEKDAPRTTDNFLRVVRKGIYDGTPFHRVIENFVAQGGDPQGTGMGGPGWTVAFEKNSLKHVPGSLAMARSQSLDSAGSQFFIDLVPLPFLDQQFDPSGKPTGGYVVFGQVLEGRAVVARLTRTMTSASAPIPGTRPDRIVHARVLKDGGAR